MKLLSGNRHNYNSRNIATGIGVHMDMINEYRAPEEITTVEPEGETDPFDGSDKFGEW